MPRKPRGPQALRAADVLRVARLLEKGSCAPLEGIASIQKTLADYAALERAAGREVSLRVVQYVESAIRNLHEQQAAIDRQHRPE